MRRTEERQAHGSLSRAVQKPLRVFIPYTSARLARAALCAAAAMARDLKVEAIVTAVHVVPYPLSLNQPDVSRNHLLMKMRALANSCSFPVRTRLVMARDNDAGYIKVLPAASVVIIATRRRWWRTREEALARTLIKGGYRVVLLTVKQDEWTVAANGFPADLAMERVLNHA